MSFGFTALCLAHVALGDLGPLYAHSWGRSHPGEVNTFEALLDVQKLPLQGSPALSTPSHDHAGGSTTWCNGHHPLAVPLESLEMLSLFPKQGQA